MASFLVPKAPVGLAASLSNESSFLSMEQSKALKKERHVVRPPVKHECSPPGAGMDVNPPEIFQHELLQNFSFSTFCKVQEQHLSLIFLPIEERSTLSFIFCQEQLALF